MTDHNAAKNRIDLDELELDASKYDFETDGVIVLDLIQRLREAEAGWKASSTQAFELEEMALMHEARITQLERVRRAVLRKYMHTNPDAVDELDAALAAVDSSEVSNQ